MYMIISDFLVLFNYRIYNLRINIAMRGETCKQKHVYKLFCQLGVMC